VSLLRSELRIHSRATWGWVAGVVALVAMIAAFYPAVRNLSSLDAIYASMPPALQAKTKVMKNGDKGTFAGVPVEAVVEYNTTPDRLMFHPKGRDNGYVLTMGGKRVYLAGGSLEFSMREPGTRVRVTLPNPGPH